MTPQDFHRSLEDAAPPAAAAAPLQALWWARNGDWDKAHHIAQNDGSADAAWVHAYLHRVEGDLGNAAYWYRQARKPVCSASLETEWTQIVETLLGA